MIYKIDFFLIKITNIFILVKKRVKTTMSYFSTPDSNPTKMVFHHLKEQISARLMPDKVALDEIMKNVMSVIGFRASGTRLHRLKLPQMDVLSHLENESYMVLGLSSNPDVGVQRTYFNGETQEVTNVKGVYIKENTKVMNLIRTFTQIHQDVESMNLLWMEVEGLPDGNKAIFSIELE